MNDSMVMSFSVIDDDDDIIDPISIGTILCPWWRTKKSRSLLMYEK